MTAENKRTLVQFGAGNIGRSFIGQLFSHAGFEVVFVDIDSQLVEQLNAAGGYTLVIKSSDGDRKEYIDRVRAVDGSDHEAVASVVAAADYVATSVGSSALPHIYKVLADGIQRRDRPVDIIIAENMRDGARIVAEGLRSYLPDEFPLEERVGLVETSIGKMVPIMSEKDKNFDPLQVFAEPYNTLIVDRCGFVGEIPPLPGLKAVDHIDAYVDRKLFVHNLGHAAAAYLGYAADSTLRYIWQVLDDVERFYQVRRAMQQGAAVVRAAHPGIFTEQETDMHIDDLLERFCNKALGDTVFRVGRDLMRKLGRNDRIVGAMLLAAEHGLPFDAIAAVYCAALSFKATNEEGQMDKKDAQFHKLLENQGIEGVLRDVSGLGNTEYDRNVFETVRETCSKAKKERREKI